MMTDGCGVEGCRVLVVVLRQRNDDADGVGGEVVLLFIHQQRAGTRCVT